MSVQTTKELHGFSIHIDELAGARVIVMSTATLNELEQLAEVKQFIGPPHAKVLPAEEAIADQPPLPEHPAIENQPPAVEEHHEEQPA